MTTLDDLIKDDFDANEHDAFPDEGSISGDPRTEARLLALQAIFQHVFVNQDLDKVRDEFTTYYVKERDADKKLFNAIVNDVTTNQERYETLIASHLNEKWSYERIGLVEKSLLMAAISELSCKNTPIKVVLNEFINIAKGYFSAKEVGFVNGILNRLAIIIREPDSDQAQTYLTEAETTNANAQAHKQKVEGAKAHGAQVKADAARKAEIEAAKAKEIAIAAAEARREEKRAIYKERDRLRDEAEEKLDYELNHPEEFAKKDGE